MNSGQEPASITAEVYQSGRKLERKILPNRREILLLGGGFLYSVGSDPLSVRT
jgi:hypothetical protein